MVRIADLLPYEGAVVGSTVDEYERKINAGVAIDPPKVLRTNGELIVRNGAHRVSAYKRVGKTDIEVEISSDIPNRSFADQIPHAKRRGRQGFANVTVVASEEEREAFTKKEMEEDQSYDFMASLAGAGGGGNEH